MTMTEHRNDDPVTATTAMFDPYSLVDAAASRLRDVLDEQLRVADAAVEHLESAHRAVLAELNAARDARRGILDFRRRLDAPIVIRKARPAGGDHPCAHAECERTFPTSQGAAVHFSRTHGPASYRQVDPAPAASPTPETDVPPLLGDEVDDDVRALRCSDCLHVQTESLTRLAEHVRTEHGRALTRAERTPRMADDL